MAGFALVSRPPPPSPVPRPVSRLWLVTGPVLVALVGSVVLIGVTRVPYRTLSPGGARSVEPLIEVAPKPGGPKVAPDRPDPDLLYVTVSVRDPRGFEALLGVLDDRVEVVPSKPLLGTQSPAEDRALNLQLMADSQDKARTVALERLGYPVTINHDGAFVEDVDPSFAVSKVLKPGSTVVGADARAVATADDLVVAIRAHRPGDRIALSVRPLGERRAVKVTSVLGSQPADPKVATLGVSVSDAATFTYPVDIAIDTGKVGGPSAGLAFTLAILDRLTPGDLLGQQRVAVTGTIELDGSIGPVGGVDHKARAAIAQGAKLFIVPPDEYAGARQAAGSKLQVRKAATLDEALKVLREFGGDPLPAAKAP